MGSWLLQTTSKYEIVAFINCTIENTTVAVRGNDSGSTSQKGSKRQQRTNCRLDQDQRLQLISGQTKQVAPTSKSTQSLSH